MADTVAGFFTALPQHIDPKRTAGINATYQFNIEGDGGGDWYVELVDGAPTVAEGAAENPNITLSASTQDWLDIVNGKLSGQSAFLTGRLKLKGDVALAMKLQSIMG